MNIIAKIVFCLSMLCSAAHMFCTLPDDRHPQQLTPAQQQRLECLAAELARLERERRRVFAEFQRQLAEGAQQAQRQSNQNNDE